MPNSNLSRQLVLMFLVWGKKKEEKADVCKISLVVNNSLSGLNLSTTSATPEFCSFVVSAQPCKTESCLPPKSHLTYILVAKI